MPTGFEIDQGHWDLIIEFIGDQANLDGVVDEREMVDLMRQWWKFINDKTALTAEINLRRSRNKADEILKLRTRLTELER